MPLLFTYSKYIFRLKFIFCCCCCCLSRKSCLKRQKCLISFYGISHLLLYRNWLTHAHTHVTYPISKVRRGEQIWKLSAQRSEFFVLDAKQSSASSTSSSHPHSSLIFNSQLYRACARSSTLAQAAPNAWKCSSLTKPQSGSILQLASCIWHPVRQCKSCWSRSVKGVLVPLTVIVGT